METNPEPLFLRRNQRGRAESKSVITESMQLLFRNERNNGRQDVYDIIEEVFSPSGSFKGRIFFDDADDLIREIKLRLAEKDKN